MQKKHILNEYFDNIFVLFINDMEFQNIKYKLDKKNLFCEYFKGVNGYLDKGYLNYLNKYHEKQLINPQIKKLTKGSYGHICSFIKIINQSIENKYKKILILEPDIYFSSNFDTECHKYLDFDYKLLYFGASQNKFYSENTWEFIDNNYNKLFEFGFYYCYKTLGTFALAIDQSIFNEYLLLLLEMEKTSDVCLTFLQNKYKNNCFVSYPNLICSDIIQTKTSENRISNNIQTKEIIKLRWFNNYDFINNYILKIDYKNNDNDHWILITLEINSFYENLYKLAFVDKYGLLIYPEIRQLKLIKFISKIINKNIIKIHLNKKENESIYLQTSNIFINSIKCENINLDLVKNSLIFNNILKIKSSETGKYYIDNLSF